MATFDRLQSVKYFWDKSCTSSSSQQAFAPVYHQLDECKHNILKSSYYWAYTWLIDEWVNGETRINGVCLWKLKKLKKQRKYFCIESENLNMLLHLDFMQCQARESLNYAVFLLSLWTFKLFYWISTISHVIPTPRFQSMFYLLSYGTHSLG